MSDVGSVEGGALAMLSETRTDEVVETKQCAVKLCVLLGGWSIVLLRPHLCHLS